MKIFERLGRSRRIIAYWENSKENDDETDKNDEFTTDNAVPRDNGRKFVGGCMFGPVLPWGGGGQIDNQDGSYRLLPMS